MTIHEIDTEKNILLAKFNDLVIAHNKKYPKIDCSMPYRQGEKESEKEKSDLFSKINSLILQKRQLLRSQKT